MCQTKMTEQFRDIMVTTTTKNSSSRSSSLVIGNEGDLSDSPRSTASTSTVSTVDSMESEKSTAAAASASCSQEQDHEDQKEMSACPSLTSRKSVRFSNVCTLRHTIHRNNYTPQEVEASFWSEDEMAFLNDKTAAIIQNMEDHSRRDSSSPFLYCTRGLEKHVAEERRRIVKARQAQYEAIMVVEELEICGTRLDAQGTVTDTNSNDQHDGDDDYYADLLSKTCDYISFQSRLEARRRAHQDEQYVFTVSANSR